MNSCLYKTKVYHKRTAPRVHEFSYSQFMFGIDLDELAQIRQKLKFVGINTPNLYSFHDRDHYQYGHNTLKENLKAYLLDKHQIQGVSRIFIITQLKTWGFLFNPVSFIFLYDKDNQPLGILAEVMNTFREFKMYFIPSNKKQGDYYQDQQDKLFYISPFSQLNTQLVFKLRELGDNIHLQVDERQDQTDQTFFHSKLLGEKVPLSDKNLLAMTLRYPSNTLLSFVQIHLQALHLLRKKVAWYKKSDNQHLQVHTQPAQQTELGKIL